MHGYYTGFKPGKFYPSSALTGFARTSREQEGLT